MCVSSASGCALGNFTEHAAWNTAVQELYFHPAGPEARKSGSDAAGTAVLFKVLYLRLKVFHFQDQMHAGWYRHRKPGLGNNLEGWDGEGGGKDGERCSRGRGHR